MISMTHPSGNFFVLSLFCIVMFVWLRVQIFKSSASREFFALNDVLIQREN